jgi:hypothetical protein
VADLPVRSRRVVGLALIGSAVMIGTTAAAAYTGLLPFAEDLRGTLSLVLGAVALVDFLLGFWFFRASLTS